MSAADAGTSPEARADDAPSTLDAAVARVEQELAALFARVRVGWREAATMVHPDLQPLGYQVLISIASGMPSASAVVDRLQTDKSAVSRQVRQLEELGLVESLADPQDRRARILVATELARERIAAARALYEARLAQRLRAWSPEDLDRFARMLGDLGR